MIEEVGKEGVAEGGQPGKERPTAGSKEASASVSVSIFIPTVSGSSLVAVAFLSLSMVCQGVIPLAPTLLCESSPLTSIGSWLAPGSSGHSSFWPFEV